LRFLITALISAFAAIIHIVMITEIRSALELVPGKSPDAALVGPDYGASVNLCLLAAAFVLSVYAWVSVRQRAYQQGRSSLWTTQRMAVIDHTRSAPPFGAIVGKSGMYANAVFQIADGEELVIGRDAVLSNIVVDTNAEKVSRKHCSVVYFAAKRKYRVTDFSSNGTYKGDGERLEPHVPIMLPCGSSIYLGNRRNEFLLN